MTALREHTFLPPEASSENDVHELVRTMSVDQVKPQRPAVFEAPDGTRVSIPPVVVEVLRNVVEALQHGMAITVAPHSTLLTTQEAADMLDISRPTFVRRLEAGEIPFEFHGRHRRVRLEDVLDYQARSRAAALASWEDMIRQGEEDGIYEATEFPQRTR